MHCCQDRVQEGHRGQGATLCLVLHLALCSAVIIQYKYIYQNVDDDVYVVRYLVVKCWVYKVEINLRVLGFIELSCSQAGVLVGDPFCVVRVRHKEKMVRGRGEGGGETYHLLLHYGTIHRVIVHMQES